LKTIEKCKQQYFDEYRPAYEQLAREKEKLRATEAEKELKELSITETNDVD
jgi:hypothetical protein